MHKMFGHITKNNYIYSYFKKVGKSVKIFGNIHFLNEENIEIGNNVHINEGVMLNGKGGITIGDDTTISSGSQILSTGLDIHHVSEHIHKDTSISIGRGVWICSHTIIAGNISIGDGSVISANSFVNKDIPKHELWGGIPAKKIKSLK